MAKIKLTKSNIDRWAAGTKDQVYWDEAVPGFGLKVTPKGRKVFFVLYRTRDGSARLRKYTIGPYGIITPAIARSAALRILAARQDGRDPAGEKRQARTANIRDKIDDVIDAYIERHASLKKSREPRRVLKREVLSTWSGKSINAITKQDVVALLDQIVDRGSPSTANRTYKSLRALFNWCIGRSLLEKSPCSGLALPVPEKARDRVLTDDELGSVIQAARDIGFPYGSLVEILILTAQRRGEVAGLQWSEIDLKKGIWCLPASRTKNGREHIVHLSPQALRILEASPRRTGFVFGAKETRPFGNFCQAKEKLDELSSVKNWVLHDLRRTAVTGMAGLGVPPHIADKVLNHQSGTISGVAAVYQKHQFLDERREGLLAWGKYLCSLLQSQALIAA